MPLLASHPTPPPSAPHRTAPHRIPPTLHSPSSILFSRLSSIPSALRVQAQHATRENNASRAGGRGRKGRRGAEKRGADASPVGGWPRRGAGGPTERVRRVAVGGPPRSCRRDLRQLHLHRLALTIVSNTEGNCAEEVRA